MLSDNLIAPITSFEPDQTEAPISENDGRVRTLNNMGSMSPNIDIISNKFIQNVSKAGSNVHNLEIGCAYGNAAIEALTKGAKNYTIVDLDNRHIQVAMNRIHKINPQHIKNVTAISGDFLSIDLPSDYYNNILVARVIHFFSAKGIERFISKLHRIVAPGGIIYIVAATPYLGGYQSFIPVYEQRKSKGELWPGYVSSMLEYKDKTHGESLPDTAFHFLDADILGRSFRNEGFEIIESREFPLEYESKFQFDGRENVGLIVKKPDYRKGRKNI